MVSVPTITNTPATNITQNITVKPKNTSNSANFNKMLGQEVTRLQDTPNKIKSHTKASSAEIREAMAQVQNANKGMQESHHSVLADIRSNSLDETGMKNALKELAKQFENEINSMLWHKIIKKEHGSLLERLYSSQYTAAYVKAGDTELGEIGENVYQELLEEMKQKTTIGDQ